MTNRIQELTVNLKLGAMSKMRGITVPNILWKCTIEEDRKAQVTEFLAF